MSDQHLRGPGTIITPEAVALDFNIAGLASRSLAIALDFLIQGAALFALILLSAVALSGSGVVGIVVLLVGIITIVIGYPVAMETLNSGRSVGRIAVGTRVVTVEGAPVRFRHAVIRAFLGIIDLLASLGAIAVLFAMFTRRGQRLGDLAAGTMVVRERSSALHTRPVWFSTPPNLKSVVDTMDTSALTPQQYQTLRDFMIRRDEIFEPARTEIATRLAAEITTSVASAELPADLAPEWYLAAVAAATQRDDAPPPPAWPPPPPLHTGPAAPLHTGPAPLAPPSPPAAPPRSWGEPEAPGYVTPAAAPAPSTPTAPPVPPPLSPPAAAPDSDSGNGADGGGFVAPA